MSTEDNLSYALMQPRCVHCKREQYALDVYQVSRGEAPCCWCGRLAPVFYDIAAYRAALMAPLEQQP